MIACCTRGETLRNYKISTGCKLYTMNTHQLTSHRFSPRREVLFWGFCEWLWSLQCASNEVFTSRPRGSESLIEPVPTGLRSGSRCAHITSFITATGDRELQTVAMSRVWRAGRLLVFTRFWTIEKNEIKMTKTERSMIQKVRVHSQVSSSN